MRVSQSNSIVSGLGTLPAPVPLRDDERVDAELIHGRQGDGGAPVYADWLRTSGYVADVSHAWEMRQAAALHATRAYGRSGQADAAPAKAKAQLAPSRHFSEMV